MIDSTIKLNNFQTKLLKEIKDLCTTYLALQKSRLSRTWSKLFSQYQKRGIYIYGDVGRGKTTICQIFFDDLSVDVKKQSIHYDQFMLELLKDKSLLENAPLVEHYKELDVLWIDELQIYDIASAMLLKKIIPELLDSGIFVVMSGNIDPIDFYKEGINRESFCGFIPYFYENFDCISLKGESDFRRAKFNTNQQLDPHKFYLSAVASNVLWNTYFKTVKTTPCILEFEERMWELMNTYDGSIYITMEDLLSGDRGACDYIHLTQNFKKIYVESVNAFTDQSKDLSRRFMIFIDSVYEYKRELYISSSVSIEQLFQVKYTDISYDRTFSRLIELLS